MPSHAFAWLIIGADDWLALRRENGTIVWRNVESSANDYSTTTTWTTTGIVAHQSGRRYLIGEGYQED